MSETPFFNSPHETRSDETEFGNGDRLDLHPNLSAGIKRYDDVANLRIAHEAIEAANPQSMLEFQSSNPNLLAGFESDKDTERLQAVMLVGSALAKVRRDELDLAA